MIMKKFFLATFICCTVALFCTLNSCNAKDVWVSSRNGINVYVMDETIKDTITNYPSRYFDVSIKKVQNGSLLEVESWHYSKVENERWNARCNKYDSSVLMPRDFVFEFCMKKLGWSYKITQDKRYAGDVYL